MSNLKHVEGRVIMQVDLDGKNNHTFKDGTKIRLERDYNNLDRKHTQQVLGTCIDAEKIPTGAIVLFHHNSTHPVNQVFDHDKITGDNLASNVKIFSIPEKECYLWKMEGEKEWHPTHGFAIAERVFEPYTGLLEGIQPKQIKDVLFIKSGELKNNVVHTLKACDLVLIFNNEEGIEEQLIRCRHFENEEHEREEIIAISGELTKKVLSGEVLVGISISDAIPFVHVEQYF